MPRLLVSILCCLALSACSSRFPCDQEKGPEATSPNHQLTATVVYIGCGAIAKDATWVTLHRTGEKYDRSSEVIFSAAQQQAVEVSWIDDTHLSLNCRCRDEVVGLQVTKKAGTNISYK